jgi:hypothetical protein
MPTKFCMQRNKNTQKAVAVGRSIDRYRKLWGKQQWAVKIHGRIHWQALFGAFAAAAGGPCCRARKQGKCPSESETSSQRIRNGQGSMHGSVRWGKRIAWQWQAGLIGHCPLSFFLSFRSFNGGDRIGVSLLRIFLMEVSAFSRDQLVRNASFCVGRRWDEEGLGFVLFSYKIFGCLHDFLPISFFISHCLFHAYRLFFK